MDLNDDEPAFGRIRQYKGTDLEAVLHLNTSCEPEVGSLDQSKVAFFLESSGPFWVVENEGRLVGMFVGLTDRDCGYQSSNFRWFAQRYSSFAYIDRIALSPEARGHGLGPDLYRRFESWAVDVKKAVLVAEVNTVPDNPRSHRFHQVAGFVEVARCHPYGPGAEVAMYEKCID